MKILDLSNETTKINIDKYLVPRLYATAIIIDETTYKLPSKSLKKLFTRLQREHAFT